MPNSLFSDWRVKAVLLLAWWLLMIVQVFVPSWVALALLVSVTVGLACCNQVSSD